MSDGSGVRRFIGGLLMAVGGLIAGLSGLCTGGFVVAFLYIAARSKNIVMAIQAPFLPIMFGIFPFAIGLGLFFWGRSLLRPPAP